MGERERRREITRGRGWGKVGKEGKGEGGLTVFTNDNAGTGAVKNKMNTISTRTSSLSLFLPLTTHPSPAFFLFDFCHLSRSCVPLQTLSLGSNTAGNAQSSQTEVSAPELRQSTVGSQFPF